MPTQRRLKSACAQSDQGVRQAEMPEQVKKSASTVLADLSIVAVDDNANTRRMLNELLLAFGAQDLRFAADGETALSMISLRTPDLVLCDWHMEPMDGIALLCQLRHRDSGAAARTPAIMLTAHTKPEVVKASMDAGANHFVAKPIVPANLLKRIQWVRSDKRIFVLEGDHYVLRTPGEVSSRRAVPAASIIKTANGGVEEVWEV